MTGRQLKYSALSSFIQFCIDEKESNLLLLSLVNNRYAVGSASHQDLRRIELSVFSRIIDPEDSTLMKVWLISNDPTKTTEHYIQSYAEFLIAMFSVRRLFLKKPELVVAISIYTSNTLMPWFSAKIAARSARILKAFFPSASFKLETTAMYPTFKQFYPLIAELAPVLTNVRCSPNVLHLLRNAHLNTLNIVDDWNFIRRTAWYYPELFHVKAREFVCGHVFPLDYFTNGSFPIQPTTQVFVCDVNLRMKKSPGLYEDIFGEISQCLPNLRLLKCNQLDFVVEVGDNDDHVAIRRGNVSKPYTEAIELASWHIREIARLSHLETEIEVLFEFYHQAYVDACADMFSRLLPGSSVCESSYNSEMESTQKHVTYQKNNTLAKLTLSPGFSPIP
ncbi:unnamed protein product [Bursaphelenchus xylophilus]|uniref:(pine wood nematode) hypothetical protein n=1 Tax=Bursaphelenchus xylophilus TaxID=6326 RepID=A0A1I7SV21_BURXY|nr:unnamed protein product [Bursaphelenchus xylophilus]CAG9100759.1 unnamed protein product [Bursaphelenchus xylophilus]